MINYFSLPLLRLRRLWEDGSTWGSAGVPRPGSAVTLPRNTRVLVTGCSWQGNGASVFTSIRIPDSSEVGCGVHAYFLGKPPNE